MKILVVGSNSFSGSDFVRHALLEGHDILAISRSEEVDPVFRRYGTMTSESNFKFRKVDLNALDSTDLDAVKAFRPTYVFNFAAQSMVGQSWSTPEDWYQTNVVSLAKFVNQLENLDSLERYVHITTPEVYGSTHDWISEGEPFNPSTPYAASRAAGDMHMRLMHREKNFPVIFTRSANVFGAGQQLYRVVPRAFLSALTGSTFELHGGGYSRRSFIHISDVSAATLLIASRGDLGTDYHISTDELVTIRDLVSNVYTMAGAELDLGQANAPDRIGKDAGYFLSSQKLKSQLDWEAKVSLGDGLQETLDWVKANLGKLREMPWDYSHKK